MTDERINDGASVGDRLIALEPLSSDSREHIQQELHAMFTRELRKPARLFCGAVAIASLVMAFVCGFLAATEPQLPLIPRIGLGTGTLFGLAWTIVAGRACWRGSMDLRTDSRRIASMVWVFTVLMTVFFLILGMTAKDRMLGLMVIVQSLAFLVGAGVYWVTHRIEQSELSTREALLRLELRLAELGEKR